MNYTDDVNGIIVGTYYGQAWLTYEGRKQGQTIYAETIEEADSKLYQLKETILKDQGDVAYIIYPNKQGWMFHFDGL